MNRNREESRMNNGQLIIPFALNYARRGSYE